MIVLSKYVKYNSSGNYRAKGYGYYNAERPVSQSKSREENSGEGTAREMRVSSTTHVYENGCVSEQICSVLMAYLPMCSCISTTMCLYCGFVSHQYLER